ncbi:MAG: FAD-dependent oxidoreductase [Bacillota bacterium]|jgi:NADPH-dependent 2,4-dienoyl-CoA reductase/sulfur reductase-like enzyme|uniref:FAD-dependent oxidoreductase n=1 Tax=Desulforudis sp. DRI-14 TaxID=3459793 RepID=UPI00349740A9
MANAYDIVVVGGGTAGVTAATTARRHYPDKKVLVIRHEEKTLIPCGIPYMFGTLKADPLKNVNPDYVLEKRGIELRVGEVTGLDRNTKKISLASGGSIGYDKLVLATGSHPVSPPIPGRDKENVFWITKSLPHLQKIFTALDTAAKVVIVGGGFVGVEVAEEIKKHRGLDVTIVEILPCCLYSSFDEEICVEAEHELEVLGVKILTNQKVKELTGDTRVQGVVLADGTELPADVVILSTGVRPITSLASKAGLTLGPLGGIMVDRTMATSDPNIFACGDCTEKFSFFAGNPVRIQLASVASMEARVAGANLYVRRRTNPGTVGVFSTFIGTKAFGCAGLTERAAEEKGYEVLIGEASAPNQHPSALPGTQDTRVKLVFDRYSGVLLGGQVVGSKSVGDLVNLLSACLLHRMTATQMAGFQMGTHPMLTPSPAAYPLVVAAEAAATERL